MTFLKTKDFMVMLKAKLHAYYNKVCTSQFVIKGQPTPFLLKVPETKEENEPSSNSLSSYGIYRFYTDATGNNHPIVRQILKRRPWLFRVDKLKGGSHHFDQVNFFWTQWFKSSISERLKPHQIYSKIENNFLITNKSNLLNTMTEFYA